MQFGRTRVMVLVVAAFVSACEKQENRELQQPLSDVTLASFASVRLQERDTAYIAKPNALAVSATGEFYVTDMLSRKVLRFDSTGSFLEMIGRRGGGPNEFEGPFRLTPVNDSTLAVVDVLRRQVVLWDLRSKTVQARLPFPGQFSSPQLVVADGSLYASAVDVQHGSAGLRWRNLEGEPERLGQILDVYLEQFPTIWGNVALDVDGDSIVYFGGRSEYVIVADKDWRPRDSFPIPKLTRRGIPHEIDYSLSGGRNIYDLNKQLSVPYELRNLSGGRYAVFHLDASILPNNTVIGRVFMTVVSMTGLSRCVDVMVPTHDSTSIPRLSFLADTLFVLDQFVVADTAISEIRKYRLGTDVC